MNSIPCWKSTQPSVDRWPKKPGPNYWHNTVDYDISIEVVPSSRELIGSEKIVFNNNSPDELNRVVIRLYQDAFKKGNIRGSRVRASDVNDGIEISNLKIADQEVDMATRVRRSGTNMSVSLDQPLAAGGSLTIELDWKTVIPETTIRMGAYDSTAFFVAYW